jgi:hypothetical protein
MSKKQTIITRLPTREEIALVIADAIQTCINTDTRFMVNFRADKKTVTFTAKHDYDKFKVLFPKATIKSDTFASLYCELIYKYE